MVSREVYGLRVWIEQGFRILKREGWDGRRTDSERVDRHWLAMAVATLPARTQPRMVSVFRLGLTPLRRLCYQGRTWQRLCLRPESTCGPPLLPLTA